MIRPVIGAKAHFQNIAGKKVVVIPSVRWSRDALWGVAVKCLCRFADCGVELHLDDFGTGYSSLAYLHRFPVNALKIDKSFVSGLGRGLANPEIVETVIALARQLDLSVTAERIETSEQEQQLRALNCLQAQGNLLLEPRDTVAATTYLLGWLSDTSGHDVPKKAGRDLEPSEEASLAIR